MTSPYKEIVLGVGSMLAVMFLLSLWDVASLRRCTRCRPHCPNGHELRIVGSAGLAFGTGWVLLWMLIGLLTVWL